ncbi:bifunctional diguanylate cyclase/phosphodiesterase [Inmirania thermothiophila]|uniref:PAS domain S-box-containing protein/diguanylate cyclase (GGDEF)-like protein n=1 Tax=Inmirania thermothiophila TaxID=1750597 RepID=A0A3N1Y8K5_9GAMM|nr:EAL domain-containing protein [Inmirania thermothiophila]ROR35136.1 PAS domain S-box-containing protein/diguanylate cyclase (GGDEF)-like protein [Inmirania thermothiophila]
MDGARAGWRAWIAGGAAALAAAALVLAAAWRLERIEAEQARARARVAVWETASHLRVRLEQAVNERLHLATGLAAFVRAEPGLTPEAFRLYAAALHRIYPDVRSLQLAPGAVVRHVYPLAGNEAALGHDLLADPARREAAERAIREHSMVVAGPVQLRQGGVGIIARLPVYLPAAAGGERFWGFAIVLLDLEPVLRAGGLVPPPAGLMVALRGRDGLGARGEVFYGPPELFRRDAVRFEIALPHGSWQLAAAPAGGWPAARQERARFWLVAALLAAALGAAAGLLVAWPLRLRWRVGQATAAVEEQLLFQRALLEAVPLPVFHKGLDGRLLGGNAAAERLFGVGPGGLAGRRIAELLPQQAAECEATEEALLAAGEARAMPLRLPGPGGRGRELVVHKAPWRDHEGRLRGLIGVAVEVTRERRLERMLETAAVGFSGASGRAWHRCLVRYLREVLEADWVYVGELEEGGGEARIRAVAVAGSEGDGPLFAYPLRGAPCEQALAARRPVLIEDVTERFPGAILLRRLGVGTYAGEPLLDADGSPMGMLVVLHAGRPRDPEEVSWALRIFAPRAAGELVRARREEALRVGAAVFEASGEAIMVTDAEGRIRAVNPAFTRITGYSAEEAVGQTPAILKSGRHAEDFYRAMWEALEREGRWEGEIWNRRRNGEVFPEWLSIAAVRDAAGRTTEYVAVFADITRRKEDEARIWRQANYDALTGLPNRTLFFDRLARAVSTARRIGGRLAVLFVDLDRFKWVNDTLGHAAGDALLQEAARRLARCVRESDTVARLAGDEFTVVLAEIRRAADAERVARAILAELERPYVLEGQEVQISGSVGIAIFPEDGEDAETLLRHADAAMYRAKEAGRNAYGFFTPEMDAEAAERAAVEQALRAALAREELALVYQPVWDLAGEGLAGLEALLRWHHPERGLLAPEAFLAVAEEAGLLGPLTRWVLARLVRDAARWGEAGLAPLPVGVNLAARLLRDGALLHEVVEAAGRCAPAWRLAVEVREAAGEEGPRGAAARLGWLQAHGIGVILDDFGTGNASLTRLRSMPLEAVKVDGSLLREAAATPAAARVVEALVDLAHGLGLTVIAEQAEDEALVALARRLGFDRAQGFALAAPMELEALLRFASRGGEAGQAGR